MLSCAENDHAFDAEARKKVFELLQKENKRYHVQLFYGVSHGFAVKGDPEDPYQSEFQALEPRVYSKQLHTNDAQDGVKSKV